jgi:hypothetical protein
MEPLFEAKASYGDQYALYNVHRLDHEKYKAELISHDTGNTDAPAPAELILSKKNGTWQTDDNQVSELISTIGIEIDVFNNGYGALLGRIGVR